MPVVSVVIPNYNSVKYIENCLISLKKQTFHNFDIIVVDNASKDESLKIVEEKFPDIKIIRLDDNYGFSKAVNEGIKAALGEYVILLNDDIETEPDYIETIYNAIDENDLVFSVSPKMIQLHNKELLDGAGDLYSAMGWAFARGKDKRVDTPHFNKRIKVFASCGGASIYRKSVFSEIGLFDEYNFAYLEDVDIGYRARINGYINIYEPSAVVYHAGSAVSGSRYNDFKIRLSARNNVYVAWKNMPLLQLLFNSIFLLSGFFIKGAVFTLKGFGRPYFSGLYRGILMCKRERKTKFRLKNIKNYFRIELELLCNIFRRF